MRHEIRTLILAVSLVVLFATLGVAQTKKPRIKYYRINTNQTFHVRLNDTLKSDESRVGETFETTIVDPVYSSNGVELVPSGSTITEALNQHDLDGIMSVFAASPKTVVMGTGPGERWQGKDEIRAAYTEIVKDFDKGTATHNCDWKTGEIVGATAWVASTCKFSDSKSGQKREYELNVSGVLRKIGGKWYFQSLHYSNMTGSGGN